MKKNHLKWLIILPTTIATIPLVAAACNNSKPEPAPAPDPNLDQKAVTDSLNNIKVEVADKNKLPSKVEKTNITISEQVQGFTYTVESLTSDDKTGELTVRVKSTKNNLSATKDFKINGFTKETPAPTPETDEQKFAKITFTYNGTIESTLNKFEFSKVTLTNNDGFSLNDKKSNAKIKDETNPSIFPIPKRYVIAKLVFNRNEKTFETYVKFETAKNNSVGIKSTKDEYDKASTLPQPMPKPDDDSQKMDMGKLEYSNDILYLDLQALNVDEILKLGKGDNPFEGYKYISESLDILNELKKKDTINQKVIDNGILLVNDYKNYLKNPNDNSNSFDINYIESEGENTKPNGKEPKYKEYLLFLKNKKKEYLKIPNENVNLDQRSAAKKYWNKIYDENKNKKEFDYRILFFVFTNLESFKNNNSNAAILSGKEEQIIQKLKTAIEEKKSIFENDIKEINDLFTNITEKNN
ncbi:proline-rich putative variable surface lipoprotein [[Mycoplasma] phocae]|uniref:Proline-rich putative variable surface lipoprotein n=1 Tax=[Mycoplasma] phocae TaxID=142651 RepID=A0A2Z5IQ77_9BACT|nr:lipoprotein 17-related variable surface protein [[Mycoplasma] phocae]AXE60800.1 proline-rich putative variable surface lipoprotein [[Mycoplasma] phocae]